MKHALSKAPSGNDRSSSSVERHTPRYPGYDVMRKRDSVSWDDATRAVIDHRLAQRNVARFCNALEWQTLQALCAAIIPQAAGTSANSDEERNEARNEAHDKNREPAVPLAAYIDAKLADDVRDGFRDARLPPLREAWRTGLAALDAASRARHGVPFAQSRTASRDDLIRDMQRGALHGPEWHGMPSALFFTERVLHDLASAYYGHPQSWNEIGFGGPANPRGYVRMQANRRDPWEPAEAHDTTPAGLARVTRENRRVR